MTSPRYDSVLISIDWISFRYFFRRDFRAYIVVITADTNGSIGIYESPESYTILHRPMRDKPATIDFGFDGFVIYSSAGAVPDLVRFDVFVVKDRSSGRRAGAVLEQIRSSKELEAKVDAARAAMASATSDGAMAASVASAVTPVLDLVGGVVEDLEDQVIEAYAGSKIFDGALVSKDEGEPRKRIHQAVVSPTGNIETKVDITLFQRQGDTSSTSGPDARPDGPPVDRDPPETIVRHERPQETTATEPVEITDPDATAISLRRPRALFRVGWVFAALVPIFIVLGAAFAEPAPGVAVVAFLFAFLAIPLSPALIYGAGHWARARLRKKGLTRLGWVALVFHLISLGIVAIGVVILVVGLTIEATSDPVEPTTDPTTVAEGLITAILGKFVEALVAIFGAVVMVMISYIPWLVSVITAIVFGRRQMRT